MSAWRRLFLTFFLGFSSGLPFSAIESTLQAWLKDSQFNIQNIGLFGWVLLPYSLKFLWAPFIDAYPMPFLGRRRGWMVVSQVGVILSLGAMAMFNPASAPTTILILALCAAIFSATQDIVLDAHRREWLKPKEFGLGTSLFVNGYRIGMMASGAAALALSKYYSWTSVYWIIGAFMLVGTISVMFADEPHIEIEKNRTWRSVIIEPFSEFFARTNAAYVLAFVFLYKIGDSMAAALRTTFLLDIGYDKIDVAAIAKTFGLGAGIAGGLLGGVLMLRLGIIRSLWIFGVFQGLATLTFWWLAKSTPDNSLLAFVITADNICVGMGTTAYVAFLASICNPKFSGAQYAGLTSLIKIPALLVTTCTGYLVAIIGWSDFFLCCTAAAIPAFFLLPLVSKTTLSKNDWNF